MRKTPTRKRPYFTIKSAMTAILRSASEKMHHGILLDRRLALTRDHTPYIIHTTKHLVIGRF